MLTHLLLLVSNHTVGFVHMCTLLSGWFEDLPKSLHATYDKLSRMLLCRANHLKFLLSKKKLLLVFDLDHTLLSSTRMSDVPEDMLPKLEQLLEQQGAEDEQLLFKLPHMLMWTKLRPGIRDFLVQTHKLFELHIYTNGDQDYAAEMARLLDPNKTFFGGRVISAVSAGVRNTLL